MFYFSCDCNPCYLDKKAKVQHRRMVKLLETFVCKLNACYRLPTSHLILVSNIIILYSNLNTKKLWDRNKKYVLRILVNGIYDSIFKFTEYLITFKPNI